MSDNSNSAAAKLTPKELALLKGKNFASIATINPDGSSQLTPVWVDTDGTNIIVNTAVGRVKEKNISRDPRVAVSVFATDDPYSWVSVNGRVIKKITGREADESIDALSFKYTGNKKYQRRRQSESRIKLIIEPIHILSRFNRWMSSSRNSRMTSAVSKSQPRRPSVSQIVLQIYTAKTAPSMKTSGTVSTDINQMFRSEPESRSGR